MDPQPNQQNYQAQQVEQQYEMDIDDNYYNYEDQDYMQQLVQLTQNKSNDPSANLQYQMKDLIRRIYRQINNINQITNLGFDGTLLLYYLSSWNQQSCNTFIIEGSTQIQQIRKLNNLGFKQGRVSQQGICNVCCCMSSKLVRNVCGHLFCEQDWVQHMFYRLTYSSEDPLPKCMEQGCQARISYTICQILSQHNNNLKQKIVQVMCRSYAINNRSVKMCKGRPGFNCTRCFTVEKMLSIIECETCGNLVCPRCGQRSHGPSECKNLSKWAVIKQTTMGLAQYYQYQTCPHCKNTVQRIAGCNQILCRCKGTFCYICGEKWLPDHPNLENGADYCPNYKKLIKKFRQRKLRRKQNIIKCLVIQVKQQQLATLEQMLEKVEGYKLQLSTIIKQLMKQYPFHESQLRTLYSDSLFIKKTICLLWGEALSEYFISNQRSKFFCERIRVSLKKVYSFLFEFVLGMYNILANPKEQTTEQENENIMKAKKQFYKQYFQLQKILVQDKDNIRKITRQQYDCSVFQ